MFLAVALVAGSCCAQSVSGCCSVRGACCCLWYCDAWCEGCFEGSGVGHVTGQQVASLAMLLLYSRGLAARMVDAP